MIKAVLAVTVLATTCMASASEVRSASARASNIEAARAYQSAINSFVAELDKRATADSSNTKDFMSSLINYRSEVRVEKDGYCVEFSPKEFDGRPVFGGSITYCFDKSGTSLRSTKESK